MNPETVVIRPEMKSYDHVQPQDDFIKRNKKVIKIQKSIAGETNVKEFPRSVETGSDRKAYSRISATTGGVEIQFCADAHNRAGANRRVCHCPPRCNNIMRHTAFKRLTFSIC